MDEILVRAITPSPDKTNININAHRETNHKVCLGNL